MESEKIKEAKTTGGIYKCRKCKKTYKEVIEKGEHEYPDVNCSHDFILS